MSQSRFRPNICVVIRKKSSGQLLLCHRKGFQLKCGWQFPQGGINEKNDLLEEMKRELKEEIGTDAVVVTMISCHKYKYEFPPESSSSHPGYIGQIQQWVLAEFSDDDSKINFRYEPAEFDAFKWVSPQIAIDNIVDFKKNVYKNAMTDLGLL